MENQFQRPGALLGALSASYRDGVLQVHVAKAEESRMREIEVKGGEDQPNVNSREGDGGRTAAVALTFPKGRMNTWVKSSVSISVPRTRASP